MALVQVVGQGTIGGALISQAVLDDAVTESFPWLEVKT